MCALQTTRGREMASRNVKFPGLRGSETFETFQLKSRDSRDFPRLLLWLLTSWPIPRLFHILSIKYREKRCSGSLRLALNYLRWPILVFAKKGKLKRKCNDPKIFQYFAKKGWFLVFSVSKSRNLKSRSFETRVGPGNPGNLESRWHY